MDVDVSHGSDISAMACTRKSSLQKHDDLDNLHDWKMYIVTKADALHESILLGGGFWKFSRRGYMRMAMESVAVAEPQSASNISILPFLCLQLGFTKSAFMDATLDKTYAEFVG